MGKGERKGKRRYHVPRELGKTYDDFTNDFCSVASSDLSDTNVLDEISDYEEDEQQDTCEDHLKDAVEGLTQKSAKGRTSCFHEIEKSLAAKYLPDFVEDRKMTITDSIERGLKKGRGEEQSTAARLSTLLCVQLGSYDSAEVVCRDLRSILKCIVNDNTASLTARSECCWALSMNEFFSGTDEADTIEIKQLFTTIFAGSYLKSDGSVPALSPEVGAFHAAAISSWTLLLTVMEPGDIYRNLGSDESRNFMPSLNQLRELLQSPHLEVRMSAGEALAVIFELGRYYFDDYEQEWAVELVEDLRELATDSNKHRAKKDRKQQRATFRDILRYVREDEVPEMQIKLVNEVLRLETWCAQIQYNACCRILGPGINIHLVKNKFLREIFDLSNVVVLGNPPQPTTKSQKARMNAKAFKARTLLRKTTRDRRSVAIALH